MNRLSALTLARTRSARIERWLAVVQDNAFPIGVFAILRVWTGVIASATTAFVPPSAQAAQELYGLVPLHDAVIAPWQRWDTIWYVKIATQGYARDLSPAFFPLFPVLIRLLNFLINNAVASGVLVASIAALISFILFYQLARTLYDESAARRALLFLAAFPTAFFLFAAYSESLFLACALGAFLCARSGRWLAAGILGAFGAMARPQGILLVLPLAVEFLEQARAQRVKWRRGWVIGLVGLGSAAYFLWLLLQFGDARMWLVAQGNWRHFAPAWEVLAASVSAILHAPTLLEAAVASFDPLLAVLFGAAFVWSWFRLPRSFTIYLAIILLPPLFTFTTSSELLPLAALSRYVLVGFPAFLLLGSLNKRGWQSPLLAFSFLFQTFWLMLFVSWVFVG